MIFWDTSAIVPLLVRESATPAMVARLRELPQITVWWGTRTECVSGLERRRREGMPAPDADAAMARLEALTRAWHEVLPTEAVRVRAEQVLRRHPLRAADALQLGAALEGADGRPDGHRFLTHDARLRAAARGEGFRID